MKTNPAECLYCTKNQTQQDLMIKICDLSVSELFLFKEQSYHGRTLVAYKGHVDGLFELTDEERNAFMADVAKTAAAMDKAFHPDKINFGAYSDTLSHLHFHIVPKYQSAFGWGGVFEMNPKQKYLSDAEYTQVIDAIKAAL
jgi:Diadenosine tetraphosphate (Ap4A) hydrolase and other HIT family hydrolases